MSSAILSTKAYVRLYPKERLLIKPKDGTETLDKAYEAFPGERDSCFLRWGLNVPSGIPTGETEVKVFRWLEKNTLPEMFGGFGCGLEKLILQQGQIEGFALEHKDKLPDNAHRAFFLFEVRRELFIASVLNVLRRGPSVKPHRFSTEDYPWDPKLHRLHLVVPAGVIEHV